MKKYIVASILGLFSLSALAEGHHDLTIISATPQKELQSIGSEALVDLSVKNNGDDKVSNPIIRYTIGGQVVKEAAATAALASGATKKVVAKVPAEAVTVEGKVTVTMELLWPDGEPDATPADNKVEVELNYIEALHDMALINPSVTTVSQLGQPLNLTFTVRNNHHVGVVNPRLAYSFNGGNVVKKALSCTLANGQEKEITISIPTKDITEEGLVNIALELLWRDDAEDVTPEDNKATLQSFITSMPPNRRMVVEEATGTWCGWCVRGIVGLREMRKEYGDRFIGIAVHSKDEMAEVNYSNFVVETLGVTGYPSCFVNRDGVQRNPNPLKLKELMDTSFPPYSDINVAVEGTYKDKSVDVTASVTPLVDIPSANYRVVFVIIEDGIHGVQYNYYYDGKSGEMGGFEKLPANVEMDFVDVARGAWPNPAGTGDSSVQLPAKLTGGQTEKVDYHISLRNTEVQNVSKCHIIALVIDGKTGAISNAAENWLCPVGIGTVIRDNRQQTADCGQRAYNLAGQPVNPSVKGVKVIDGKKTF